MLRRHKPLLQQGHETLNDVGLRESFDQHPIVHGHPAIVLIIIVIVFEASAAG